MIRISKVKKNIKRCCLLFVLLTVLPTVAAWAQNMTKDTIKIESVEVMQQHQVKPEANVGTRTTTIAKSVIETSQSKLLAELLSDNSQIYIKTQARGATATSSFRGTSSSHTQVNWNGLPINTPLMGNFDFSQVPVLFIDEVTLYHGASHTKGGSGALGGSINLNNSYDTSTEIRIMSEYGSNNTITEAASARFSYGKLTSSTRLFYQSSDNDYRYLNKMLNKNAFYERRKSAQYEKMGLMQQLFYTTKGNGLVTANVWLERDNRNLPQPIIVYRTSKETWDNDILRAYASYQKSGFTFTAAYFNEQDKFSRRYDIGLGDVDIKSSYHSMMGKAEYNKKIAPKVELATTFNYRHDRVISDNYNERTASRDNASAQVSASWLPSDKLSVQAQGTAEVNDNDFAATYAIGASYQIVDKRLTVKANHAYNHRFPTLNDIYCVSSIDRNLKPEQGFSNDATLSFTPRFVGVNWRFEGTAYYMDIQNWIMWLPSPSGGYASEAMWRPVNFKRVISKGFELKAEAAIKTGSVYHKATFNYAYSRAKDQSAHEGLRAIGKQLPYSPRNRWNCRYSLNWRNLNVIYSINFTDVRFTSADESYSTTAYTTHDAMAEYRLNISKKVNLKLSLRVENITNEYYESTQYYPMPLRSYFTAATLTF